MPKLIPFFHSIFIFLSFDTYRHGIFPSNFWINSPTLVFSTPDQRIYSNLHTFFSTEFYFRPTIVCVSTGLESSFTMKVYILYTSSVQSLFFLIYLLYVNAYVCIYRSLIPSKFKKMNLNFYTVFIMWNLLDFHHHTHYCLPKNFKISCRNFVCTSC